MLSRQARECLRNKDTCHPKVAKYFVIELVEVATVMGRWQSQGIWDASLRFEPKEEPKRLMDQGLNYRGDISKATSPLND